MDIINNDDLSWNHSTHWWFARLTVTGPIVVQMIPSLFFTLKNHTSGRIMINFKDLFGNLFIYHVFC